MNKRTIQIGNISKLNMKSLNQSDNFDAIQYLDTGSITKNKISDLQIFKIKNEKIPSRAKRRVGKNTIIYSTVRPNQEHFGFLDNPDDNLIVSTGFTTIDIIDGSIDPKFIYYLITQKQITDYLHNIGMNATSSYPSIKPEDLGNLKFKVPENIQDQQKIASVLSIFDSKIELNNKINAELDQKAKALYDYWFVQFDFPDTNGKPYKSSGGKMIWNDQLKKEIPAGWKSDKMSDWVNLDKSGDWGRGEIDGDYTERVVCIRGADINGLNGLDELNPPIRYILKKNSSKILKSHDIIIEISGGSPTQSTGRMAFITDATIKRFDSPLVCSNFCKPVSIKNKKLLYNFVYYWNSLYDSGAFFGYEGKTSGIKNLLLDSFVSSYYTVIPDEKIVDQFYSFMESVQEKKQIALSENQKLIELRDWLLPMLMNGQVKVA
jgi:restriction endonuclease S subunit